MPITERGRSSTSGNPLGMAEGGGDWPTVGPRREEDDSYKPAYWLDKSFEGGSRSLRSSGCIRVATCVGIGPGSQKTRAKSGNIPRFPREATNNSGMDPQDGSLAAYQGILDVGSGDNTSGPWIWIHWLKLA
jgi:hypothetical protein